MAKKHKGGGGAVEIIKERSFAVYVLMGGGSLLAASILFSLFGFIFLGMDIVALQIAMAFVFLAPTGGFGYIMGKSAAQRDFKLKCQKIKAEDKDRRPVDVEPLKGVFYVLPFLFVMLLLSVIASAAKVQGLQAVMAFFSLPTTLLFVGTGALVLESVTWLAFVSVLIYTLIISALYVLAYFLSVRSLRTNQARLITEMRSVRR